MYEEIRAKIAELKNKNEVTDEEAPQYEFDVACGYDMALDDILSFLDTPEEPEVDLEKEMDEYFENMAVQEHENIFEDTYHNIARHFAQWGAEHLKKQIMATRKKKNNIGAFGHPIYGKGFAKYGEMRPNGSSEIPKELEEAAEISFDEAYALTEDYRDFLAKGLTENKPRPIGPNWFCEYAKNRFIAGAKWGIKSQEKKIADAYEKGKQEGIRVVRSWESSPGQGGY